jgi:hypothetical protein
MRGMKLIAALISGASLLLLGHVGQSAEPDSRGWPQWRGPTFDSISLETALADSWPEAGPPVLWSRELGQGYSSFIAVGPHVYTLNQTLYEQAVVCLDAETGKTVWSSRYSWPYEGGGLYPGPRSTPAWYDGWNDWLPECGRWQLDLVGESDEAVSRAGDRLWLFVFAGCCGWQGDCPCRRCRGQRRRAGCERWLGRVEGG